MTTTPADPFDILDFWWKAGATKWFTRDAEFDAEIHERFHEMHAIAAQGGFDGWSETPHGALALIIVLDQFSRNLHREDAHAFANDAKALEIARSCIARGFHRAFPSEARTFFFLPFEHAEEIAAQQTSVDLFRQHGNEQTYLYALIHLDVIRRFGRFPHRNRALGRTTSPEEQSYLDTGGFSS
ncbi:uncharacterized protein (DUF924 family) [Breoghania corrubedonensis]|uniref:Uncharacterized protein (DUF924 family) n=1 Tax=Breoghania corrubedonensis TaxID=665038 RepID=A0A2T5VIA3_9HYPH|nr:DUF924 family protein [Breoghania corrubedonensis]PTW63487.1 uncharacterized protein (DUF924 family) [Breoghania corrubedonensis]